MPKDPKAINELAIQANLIGDQKEAIKLWNQVAKLQPHNAKVYINLSAVYGRLGDYEKSKSAARKAIRSAPKMKEGHLNLGRSELFLGNFSEACNVFKNIVNVESNYHSAVFMLGAAQICLGKKDIGIATIKKLKPLSFWRSLPYAFQELANGLAKAGFDKNAQDLMCCAARLDLSQKEDSTYPAIAGISNQSNNSVELPMAS